MTDKQIIIDGVDVSNFYLVCYYDNKTNELVRIEQYNDNDSSMYSDIDSYRYGYNAKITKPEELIKQLLRKEQECDMWKNLTIDNGAAALKYQQQLEAKEQECEELKEQLDSISREAEDFDDEAQEIFTEKEIGGIGNTAAPNRSVD